MYRILIWVLWAYGSVPIVGQQVWTQDRGQGYIQLGVSNLRYGEIYDKEAKATDIPRPITERIVSLYSEYGLTNRLMLSTVMPFHFLTNSELIADWQGPVPAASSLSAAGDVVASLTYNFFEQRGWSLSSKLGVYLPTAKVDKASGLRSGYGVFSHQLSILSGYSHQHFFTSIELGGIIRSEDYQDKWIVSAQIGKLPGKEGKLTWILGFSGTGGIMQVPGQSSVILDGLGRYTALYQNEQAYLTGYVKLGYHLSGFWTLWGSVHGGSAKLTGRNLLYNVALGYTFGSGG